MLFIIYTFIDTFAYNSIGKCTLCLFFHRENDCGRLLPVSIQCASIRLYNIRRRRRALLLPAPAVDFPCRTRHVYKAFSLADGSRTARPLSVRYTQNIHDTFNTRTRQNAYRSATFTGRLFRGRLQGGSHQIEWRSIA